MEKTKILTLKIYEEKSETSDAIIKVAKIRTPNAIFDIKDAGHAKDIIVTNINPINSKEAVKIIISENEFNNLDALLEKKFIIKIYSIETGYRVVITKDTCSTTFEATKEEGIVEALIQAEDWAEEMLIQLNGVKTTA